MTQASQLRPAQAVTVEEESEFEKLLKQDFKFKIEYKPYLSDETLTLSPQIVIRYFCKPTKSGAVCSPDQATRFILLCKARKLDPREGDAYIVGYDTKDGPEFNLITAIQALYKRAEAHPEYDGMESGVVVQHEETEGIQEIDGDFIPPGCTLIGGWARIHKKNKKFPTKAKINLETFRKPFGVWGTNPQGMICKCAEADALRRAFPNVLGGMYLDGEMPDGTEGLGKVAATSGGSTPSVRPNDKYAAARKIEADDSTSPPSPGAAAPRNAPGSGTNAADVHGVAPLLPGSHLQTPNPSAAQTPPTQPGTTGGPSASVNATGTTGEAREKQAGAVGAQAAPTPPADKGRPKAKKWCNDCGAPIETGTVCDVCEKSIQHSIEDMKKSREQAEGVPPETVADAFAREGAVDVLSNWLMSKAVPAKVRAAAMELAGVKTLVEAKEEDVRNVAYNTKLHLLQTK